MTSRFYGATISEGTCRPQDLIPTFQSALEDRLEESTFEPGADAPDRVRQYSAIQDFLAGLESRVELAGDEYWDGEESQEDVGELMEWLDTIAPEGCYFGAHEGDGACYGFWLLEEGEVPMGWAVADTSVEDAT